MRDGLLVHIDVGPAGATLRLVLGAAFALATRRWMPNVGFGAAAVALAGTLFAVKVAAVLGRRVARPGPWAATSWEWRRQLARAHDSYQLRKLLWIGTGILLARWLAVPAPSCLDGLGVGCVAVGILAEARWRSKGLTVTPGRPA